jgi:hypothetical protein
MGSRGFWWSSTQSDATAARRWYVQGGAENALFGDVSKSSNFNSVRCVAN